MKMNQAKNAGEIRLTLELVTGTVGGSPPSDVLRHMVDQFMEQLKTSDAGKLWQVVEATGKYEAWKGGETVSYTPEANS